MKRHERPYRAAIGSPFVDPLHERQEPGLKKQIHDVARWPLSWQNGTLMMALLLLSGPDPGPLPRDLCAQATTDREGRLRLERVSGISHGPGCCTLPLYSRPGRSNYDPDQWS
jgi:hypothetical protein